MTEGKNGLLKQSEEIPELLSEEFLKGLMGMDEAKEEDALAKIAKVVLEQKEKVDKAMEATKVAKENQNVAERVLISAMLEHGLEKIQVHGKTFSQREHSFPRVNKDNRERMIAWLRETERGDLVQETVNSTTFAAMIRNEFLNENIDPPEFVLISKFRKLSIRKAGGVK